MNRDDFFAVEGESLHVIASTLNDTQAILSKGLAVSVTGIITDAESALKRYEALVRISILPNGVKKRTFEAIKGRGLDTLAESLNARQRELPRATITVVRPITSVQTKGLADAVLFMIDFR
jgi:hypothetical protein